MGTLNIEGVQAPPNSGWAFRYTFDINGVDVSVRTAIVMLSSLRVSAGATMATISMYVKSDTTPTASGVSYGSGGSVVHNLSGTVISSGDDVYRITPEYWNDINSGYTSGDIDAFMSNAHIMASTGNSQQDLINVKDYFNTLPPELPYFGTCDIFSNGTDGNKLFTAVWDNIQNILPGTYESTYQVKIRVSANYPGHENWYDVEFVPYKSKKYQFTFADIIGNMPESDRAVSDEQQQCALQVILGYNDPDFTQCDLVSFSVDNTTGDIVISSGGAGTTTPHSNTNPRTNDTYNPGTGTAGTQAPGQAMSIDNLLTTSYKLTETQLRDFGNYLWNNDLQLTLFANQTSPIENVLSCKRIPFDVAVQTGNPTILLGNVDTLITAQKTAATHLLDIGSVTIPVKHNSFLDFSNNISIYLPYCGIQTIPTSLCYVMDVDPNTQIPYLTGKTLNVKYIYDIIFGTCAAVLSLNGKEFAVYNGNCGIDIPITASNRAETQLSLIHSGANAAIGTVASVTKGAIMGGAIGAGLAGIDAAATMAQQVTAQMFQDRHYTTSGGFSSQIASYLSSSVTLFVESPVYDKPGDYEHENGFPCNLSCTLNTLTGYTELDGSIEISGEIPCLEEERDLLKQALQDGFYL